MWSFPLISACLTPERPALAGPGRDRTSLWFHSTNLACTEFCELRLLGVLRRSSHGPRWVIRPMGHHDPGVILPALAETRGSPLPREKGGGRNDKKTDAPS